MPTQTTNLGLTVYDAVADKQVAVKDFIQSVAGNTNSNMTNIDGVIGDINSNMSNHISQSNPHGTTKEDIGLGNAPNYGIATKAEAEAGLVDTKLMTPRRTAEAINALSGGGSGGTSVFVSARNEFEYISDINTNAIQLPIENFDPLVDLVELYLNGARLDKGKHFTLVGDTINLAFELQANEPLTYVVGKTGYKYSDLVGAPDVASDIETHNASIDSHSDIRADLSGVKSQSNEIASPPMAEYSSNIVVRLTNNNWGPVYWNSRILDTNTFINMGESGTIRIKESGFYLITTGVVFEAREGGVRNLKIVKNGTEDISYQSGYGANVNSRVSMSIMHYFNVGEYFEVKAIQTSGVDVLLPIENGLPHLSIVKVGVAP